MPESKAPGDVTECGCESSFVHVTTVPKLTEMLPGLNEFSPRLPTMAILTTGELLCCWQAASPATETSTHAASRQARRRDGCMCARFLSIRDDAFREVEVLLRGVQGEQRVHVVAARFGESGLRVEQQRQGRHAGFVLRVGDVEHGLRLRELDLCRRDSGERRLRRQICLSDGQRHGQLRREEICL